MFPEKVSEKMKITLYGTAGCHLCEEACTLLRSILAEHVGQFELREKDIADSEELIARYGVRIPVISMDGTAVELAWPFDAQSLRDFLEQCRP